MSEERRNLYRILHVQPEAPPEVIKAAYRALMITLRGHPDLCARSHFDYGTRAAEDRRSASAMISSSIRLR